jgi:hypothetical protein
MPACPRRAKLPLRAPREEPVDTRPFVAAINQLLEGASPPLSTKEDAHKAVTAFRASTATSPWKIMSDPVLAREAVASGLDSLVEEPRKVRQGALGTCGPAAFLRCWIADDPLGFVKFAAELYDTGQAKLGTTAIKPGSTLVGQDYTKNVDVAIKAKYPGHKEFLCPPAEWIVMCSLIDVSGLGIPYDGTPGDFSEGSWVFQTAGWFEDVGYTVDSWQEWDDHGFIWALSPVPKKRHIVLSINSYLVRHRTTGPLSSLRKTLSVANHFVVLDTPVRKGWDGKVQFDAWTWGETPTTTYPVTEEEIDKYVNMVVRAER